MIWYVWFVEGLLVSGNSILSYIFAFSFITTLHLNFSISSKTYFSCNIRFGDYCNSSLCKFIAYVMTKSKDNQESQVWGIVYAVKNPFCYVVILSRYSAVRFQLLACMDAHCSCLDAHINNKCTYPSTLINKFPSIVFSNRCLSLNRGRGLKVDGNEKWSGSEKYHWLGISMGLWRSMRYLQFEHTAFV